MPDNYARIFLLSHMRAYTSLAGHILGSHPRINGYFELHISYADAAALDRQLEVLLEHETLKANSRYVFDKLLHNDYRLDLPKLGPVNAKILVALLEPARAIRSIVSLFDKKGAAELYADPVEAANYYIGRLKWLAGFCRSTDRPYHYYDAALFQASPERLLPRLTDWLALDTPLTERYRLFSQTGRAGKGDSSALIHSGKIVTRRADYSHIDVPAATLARAREVYRECREAIIANAADAVVIHGNGEAY
jgi:hypothetical protein